MKQSIHILLKIERVHPAGKAPAFCVSWYLPGGGPGYDGQVNETDLNDALKTVCAAAVNRLDDAPETQTEITIEDLEGAMPHRPLAPTPVVEASQPVELVFDLKEGGES